MKQINRTKASSRFLIAIGCSGCILGAAGVASQEREAEPGGTEMRLGFSTTVLHDSNRRLDRTDPGGSTEWVNRLDFGLATRNARSVLDVSAAGDFRYQDTPYDQNGFDFVNPDVRLAYGLEGARSALTLQSRLNEQELTGLTTLVDGVTGDILVEEDDGTRRVYQNSLSYRFGIDRPFETELSLSSSNIRYDGTSAREVFDTDTYTFGLDGRAALSPVMDLNLELGYRSYDADDASQTTRDTTRASVGLSYDITKVLTAKAAIGYTRVDQQGAARLQDQDGLIFSLGLKRALPTGTVGIAYGRSIGETGARDRVSVNAEIERKVHNLSGTVGLSTNENGDTDLVADVDYTHILRSGEITLGAFQSVGTDSDGFDRLTTQVEFAWQHQLNRASSLQLSANYSAVDYSNPAEDDLTRGAITAQYNHQLTEDWVISSGVQHRQGRSSDGDDADSQAVFVTLSRDFTILGN